MSSPVKDLRFSPICADDFGGQSRLSEELLPIRRVGSLYRRIARIPDSSPQGGAAQGGGARTYSLNDLHLSYEAAVRARTEETFGEQYLSNPHFVQDNLALLAKYGLAPEKKEEEQIFLKEFLPLLKMLAEIDEKITGCRTEEQFGSLVQFIIEDSKKEIGITKTKRGMLVQAKKTMHNPIFAHQTIIKAALLPRISRLHTEIFSDHSPYINLLIEHCGLSKEEAEATLPQVIIYAELFRRELGIVLPRGIAESVESEQTSTVIRQMRGSYQRLVQKYVFSTEAHALLDRGFHTHLQRLIEQKCESDPHFQAHIDIEYPTFAPHFKTATEDLVQIVSVYEFEMLDGVTYDDLYTVLKLHNLFEKPTHMRLIAGKILETVSFEGILFLVLQNTAITPSKFQSEGLQGLLIDPELAIPDDLQRLEENARCELATTMNGYEQRAILSKYLTELANILRENYQGNPITREIVASLLPIDRLQKSENAFAVFQSIMKGDDNDAALSTCTEIFLETSEIVSSTQFGTLGDIPLIRKALSLCNPDNRKSIELLHAIIRYINKNPNTVQKEFIQTLRQFPPQITQAIIAIHSIAPNFYQTFQNEGFASALGVEEERIPRPLLDQAARLQHESPVTIKKFLIDCVDTFFSEEDHPFLERALPFQESIDISPHEFLALKEMQRILLYRQSPIGNKRINFTSFLDLESPNAPILSHLYEKQVRTLPETDPFRRFVDRAREIHPGMSMLSLARIYQLLAGSSEDEFASEKQLVHLSKFLGERRSNVLERSYTLTLIREKFAAMTSEQLEKIKYCIWEQLGCPDTGGEDTAGRLIREHTDHPAIRRALDNYLFAEKVLRIRDDNPAKKAAIQLMSLLSLDTFALIDRTTQRYAQRVYAELDEETKRDIQFQVVKEVQRFPGDVVNASELLAADLSAPHVKRALRKIFAQHRTFFHPGMTAEEKYTALINDTGSNKKLRFLQAMSLKPDASLPPDRLRQLHRELYAQLLPEDKSLILRYASIRIFTDAEFLESAFLEDTLALIPQEVATLLRTEGRF